MEVIGGICKDVVGINPKICEKDKGYAVEVIVYVNVMNTRNLLDMAKKETRQWL